MTAVGLTVTENGATRGSLLRRAQYVVFTGEAHGTVVELEVLAGDAAPTPSAGYAKWAKVQRPQRKALTILEGYEPFTLTVPVLFDAVREAGPHGEHPQEDVEDKIQWLEWMGGRGVKTPKGTTPGVGKPPLVVVYSSIGNINETPLIPKPFQTPQIKWFVNDIVWAERYPEVMRSSGGSRIRQAASVQLVEHVVDARSPSEKPPGGPRTFKTTRALNTVRKLVAKHLVGSRSRLPEAVAATIKLNSNNKKIGSNPEKKLKEGTPVKIPGEFLHI